MDESVQKHIEESLPKVGRFQHVADKMLEGCKASGPAIGWSCDGFGNTCAVGAYALAMGLLDPNKADMNGGISVFPEEVMTAYVERYGTFPSQDNDDRKFTREQIAARIAAL